MLQQKTKFKSRIFPAFSFKAGNRTVFDEGPAEEFGGKIWPLPLFYGGSQVWLTFSGTIRNLLPLFRKFQQRIAFIACPYTY